MAAKQRRTDDLDRDVSLAWRIAALERQQKLPKLQTLLSTRPARQSVAQQRGMLHVLSAQYGFPMRTRKPH